MIDFNNYSQVIKFFKVFFDETQQKVFFDETQQNNNKNGIVIQVDKKDMEKVIEIYYEKLLDDFFDFISLMIIKEMINVKSEEEMLLRDIKEEDKIVISFLYNFVVNNENSVIDKYIIENFKINLVLRKEMSVWLDENESVLIESDKNFLFFFLSFFMDILNKSNSKEVVTLANFTDAQDKHVFADSIFYI